jgi:hypothetical protein
LYLIKQSQTLIEVKLFDRFFGFVISDLALTTNLNCCEPYGNKTFALQTFLCSLPSSFDLMRSLWEDKKGHKN